MEGLVGSMQWQFLCHVIQRALSHEQNRQEHVCGREIDCNRQGLQYFRKKGSRQQAARTTSLAPNLPLPTFLGLLQKMG